jgi:hypothetical protein
VEYQQDLPLGLWGKRERSEEARTILGSPIFGMAVVALRTTYIEALVKLPFGDARVAEYHTKLKVLDEVAAALQQYVVDYQFEQRKDS